MSPRLLFVLSVSLLTSSASCFGTECLSGKLSDLHTKLSESMAVSEISNGVPAKQFAYSRILLGGYLKSAATDIDAAYLHRGPVAAYDGRSGETLPISPKLHGRVAAFKKEYTKGLMWISLLFKDGSHSVIGLPASAVSRIHKPIETYQDTAMLLAPAVVISRADGTSHQIHVDTLFLEGRFERVKDLSALADATSALEVTEYSRMRFKKRGDKEFCLASHGIVDDSSSLYPAQQGTAWLD